VTSILVTLSHPQKQNWHPWKTRLAEMYVEEPLPHPDSVAVEEPEPRESALVLEFPEPVVVAPEPPAEEVVVADTDDGMKITRLLAHEHSADTTSISMRLTSGRVACKRSWGEWAMELSDPDHGLCDFLGALPLGQFCDSGLYGALQYGQGPGASPAAARQLHRQVQSAHAAVFCDAAEDIRRLLHQFAAGFVKEADAEVLHSLQVIIDTEFPAPVMEESSITDPELSRYPNRWKLL